MKTSPSSQAPQRPLSIAAEAWRSVLVVLIFGLAPDSQDRTGILVYVDQSNKMTHLVLVHAAITTVETAAHFLTLFFAIMDCRRIFSRTVILDTHQHFDRHCSSFVVRSCKCRQRLIWKRTGKPNDFINRVVKDVSRSYSTSFTS